jgi:hypothetical protein
MLQRIRFVVQAFGFRVLAMIKSRVPHNYVTTKSGGDI